MADNIELPKGHGQTDKYFGDIMRIQPYELYGNIHFKDVLVYVLQVVYDEIHGNIDVYGVYWNKGQMGQPWSHHVPAKFTIKPDQYNDWSIYKY